MRSRGERLLSADDVLPQYAADQIALGTGAGAPARYTVQEFLLLASGEFVVPELIAAQDWLPAIPPACCSITGKMQNTTGVQGRTFERQAC
jgi:hypothetical protein